MLEDLPPEQAAKAENPSEYDIHIIDKVKNTVLPHLPEKYTDEYRHMRASLMRHELSSWDLNRLEEYIDSLDGLLPYSEEVVKEVTDSLAMDRACLNINILLMTDEEFWEEYYGWMMRPSRVFTEEMILKVLLDPDIQEDMPKNIQDRIEELKEEIIMSKAV